MSLRRSSKSLWRWWILAGLLGMGTLTGCGGEPEKTQAPVAPQPATPSPAAPSTPLAATAPAHPVTLETRRTYQWYCAQCHGVQGMGHGINAPHTAVPPRDHTKAGYMETRSDEQLFHAIKFGGLAAGRAPCMPRWGGTLDDAMIHSLVRYIRELCRCEAL
ncbi:MAG: c-type cytochrome [Nitrospinaceae bacterium]